MRDREAEPGADADRLGIGRPITVGGETAIVCVGRDTSERAQMQSRLVTADRLSSVAYMVANLSVVAEEVAAITRDLRERDPRHASRLAELEFSVPLR